MKTRILVSIITGVLASSAAQAAATVVEDINASYLNPSFTRNADISSYTAFMQMQQNVTGSTSAAQAGATVVEDINASYLNPSFTRNADVSSYTASAQQGKWKVLAASTVGTSYSLDPSGVVSFN